MSILGLLLAGAVVSTAIKVGIVVVGAKAYRVRQQQHKAQTESSQANGATASVAAKPTVVERMTSATNGIYTRNGHKLSFYCEKTIKDYADYADFFVFHLRNLRNL